MAPPGYNSHDPTCAVAHNSWWEQDGNNRGFLSLIHTSVSVLLYSVGVCGPYTVNVNKRRGYCLLSRNLVLFFPCGLIHIFFCPLPMLVVLVDSVNNMEQIIIYPSPLSSCLLSLPPTPSAASPSCLTTTENSFWILLFHSEWSFEAHNQHAEIFLNLLKKKDSHQHFNQNTRLWCQTKHIPSLPVKLLFIKRYMLRYRSVPQHRGEGL